MDGGLDDYKLDTTFYPESNYVVHTSWTQNVHADFAKSR
jgi:hypothetical protein